MMRCTGGIHIKDTTGLIPEGTTTVYIHGRKVIISNFYYVLPNSTSKGIYPLNNDTCYVYAIKWRVTTHYSLEEIRARKLYERQAVTKRDFNHNGLSTKLQIHLEGINIDFFDFYENKERKEILCEASLY